MASNPPPKAAIRRVRPDRTTEWVAADEQNTLVGGTPIRTHRAGTCRGYWCCIHNPSPHHMRGWKQYFDATTGIMFRTCTHGELHPDPDDPHAFTGSAMHIANCDGCCRPSTHIKRRKSA